MMDTADWELAGPAPIPPHPWSLSPAEAIALQRRLAGKITLENRLATVKHVAGVDVHTKAGVARGAVAVLAFPGLELVETATSSRSIAFPYIPGLLTFREGPSIMDALERLQTRPDLLMVDGQGIAHPRRMGIASHIGLLTGLPSIGCAKSRLCGTAGEPGMSRGSYALILLEGEVVGAVLRTRAGVKPLFVSPGHRIDLAGSLAYVLACCPRYRLPETIRQAHRLASAAGL